MKFIQHQDNGTKIKMNKKILLMDMEKVRTAGVIILLGVILTTLGVLSVMMIPFVWIYNEWIKRHETSNKN